ncbi:apyrase [Pycnococcus provasolii]
MRRRNESPVEQLWRYRGVIAVLAVPVLLIFAIIALMPKGTPDNVFHEIEHAMEEAAGIPHAHEGSAPGVAGSTGARRYGVVFDAGSTGSRVHVFAFDVGAGGELDLDTDTFEQLKPGLSAFKDEPTKGAESIQPLLKTALNTVPAADQPQTSIELRATAGLRLLPGTAAQELLEEVRKEFRKTKFSYSDDHVSIMDGADEGAFLWVALNYLLGYLGDAYSTTVATIDLGGGSAQIAYAISDNAAEQISMNHADTASKLVRATRGGGHKYNLYVHSYLGYGLMAFRAKVLSAAGGACASPGLSSDRGGFTYQESVYNVAGDEPSSASTCRETAMTALNADAPACEVDGECSFQGIWSGGYGEGARRIYLASFFFDLGVSSGLVASEDELEADVTAADFEAKAELACSTDADELATIFPNAKREHDDTPYLCLDLTIISSLLIDGLSISKDQPLKVIKQVKRKRGEPVEAAWALGAAIASIG